jgi:hypothetical protein
MRRAFVLGLPFAFLAAACTYDNGDARRALNYQSAACGDLTRATIDTGAQIAVDPGLGAGLFIEYASGGHYHVRTSCDTASGGTTCHWDVIVTPEAGKAISNVVPENLSGSDSVYPSGPTSFELTAQTSTELDGFTFDTDPGTAITVDSVLDGACAPSFFYWVGDGALHSGSPSNPLTLVPSPE